MELTIGTAAEMATIAAAVIALASLLWRIACATMKHARVQSTLPTKCNHSKTQSTIWVGGILLCICIVGTYALIKRR